MNIQVKVDNIDVTNQIDFRTFKKTDILTSQVDSLDFKYSKFGTRTFVPQRGQEVIVTDLDTSEVFFGGIIDEVDLELIKNSTVDYFVKCLDYSAELSGDLVANTYEDKSIQYIINDILPSGFTANNVQGTIIVGKIVFNYMNVSACIKKLATQINYNWYVDYEKDVHFFAKSTELSPFNLVNDVDENFIGGTLQIDKSNSQMRNSVYVLGGTFVGNARTETYDGVANQLQFPLANKFSEKPTVTQNGSPIAVGTEYLQDFSDGPYVALWDFNQKYLRFQTAPTAGDTIAITGTPLVPVIVKVNEPTSITNNGLRQFKIEDKSIKDTDTARQRAQAELQAYKDGVASGSFSTYTDGLRSGQTIKIKNTLLDIDESFLIKKVRAKMLTNDTIFYTITLVSFKITGIIELLQDLLNIKTELTELDENVTLTKVENILETIDIAEEVEVQTQVEIDENIDIDEEIRKDPWGTGTVTWVWGSHYPVDANDQRRAPKWGTTGATWGG